MNTKWHNVTYKVWAGATRAVPTDSKSGLVHVSRSIQTYSIMIHRRDPFRKDPWYLIKLSQYMQISVRSIHTLCHVWRIELGQYLDLLLNIFDLVLCTLQVNDLDCNCLLSPFVISTIRNDTISAWDKKELKITIGMREQITRLWWCCVFGQKDWRKKYIWFLPQRTNACFDEGYEMWMTQTIEHLPLVHLAEGTLSWLFGKCDAIVGVVSSEKRQQTYRFDFVSRRPLLGPPFGAPVHK